MKTHAMKLSDRPFNAIATGNKTIESRLYDMKRQAIMIGDEIIFTHAENPDQQVRTKITKLLRYETFEDMFTSNDPHKFGGTTTAELLAQISQFYPLADQREFGVIGIEFILLD